MSGAAVVQGASTLLDFFGTLYEGEAQARAAEYNAEVSYRNAAIAERQAYENERRTRVENKKVLGAMNVATAVAGITGGSAFDVLQESISSAELDALTIRQEGLSRAQAFREDARLSQSEAKVARTTSYIKGASGLLKGGVAASNKSGMGGGM